MLFFGSRCERLCMIQFSLVSLIPGLINYLQDCADPAFESYTKTVEKPTTLKTSDRSSRTIVTALPSITSCTDSYSAGVYGITATNLWQGSCVMDQRPNYVLTSAGEHVWTLHASAAAGSAGGPWHEVIYLQLDEDTINITSPSLRNALALSVADRRWIDLLTQIINDTWDEAHPEQPKTHGYMGSEEFIRLQFEEYLLALLSCMKYHEELDSFNAGDPGRRSREQLEAFNIEGDPALEFNAEFLAQWQNTSNYELFKRLTSDALLYSIVEPRHPCAGGLTMDDVQRRLSQQVAELHLDERVRESREALNRHISTGQKKVTTAFNNFWADIEAMREAQRKRNEEKAQSERSSIDKGPSPPFSPSDTASVHSTSGSSWFGGRKAPSVDIAQAQASVSAAGQRAGAYLNSWSTWASEKRKEWQDKSKTPSSPSSVTSPSAPTLAGTADQSDPPERGRRSMQASRSEDPITLSRSGSRRKRWSNIFLRRDSGEYGSPNRKDDGDGSEYDTANSRSHLSNEVPVHDDSSHLTEQPSKEAAAFAEAQVSSISETQTPSETKNTTTTEASTEQPKPSVNPQTTIDKKDTITEEPASTECKTQTEAPTTTGQAPQSQ
ncbi:unnamed protein product [Aspergillus oryzae]|uniref:Unnamed protein product n=2 Tax=Aspergillus oryzae TaxID=5062 RepID=A0AAN4YRF5_ASPOZ|nr:unnamed protein product [Aspergillus oryzae]GMF85083.1 unnamed protein product [Aspergillus oryzae]GMG32530.1 unnamed protein product [Aspergillus oryzae]GMG45720.1 unnamed protein product [Aspergillus oryzae var. brunneus]